MAKVRINRQKKARFNITENVHTRAQLKPRTSGRDKTKKRFFGCIANSKAIWSDWGDTTVQYQCFHTTVKQAMAGQHPQEAREAKVDEILNMLNYQVGHCVHWSDIPADKRGNVLHSFMFMKDKTKPDGSYDKTKGRMVVNGANQREHMYDMISSSTVSLTSVFLLMNIASYFKCILASYDVKGAFLNAKFEKSDEVTYIRIGKEVAKIWIDLDPSAAAFLNPKGELLLQLDKFVYGLKQAPYKYQQHLNTVLLGLGYTRLLFDDCLYVKRVGQHFSLLSTHVDDILQVTKSQELLTELHQGLVKVYKDITFNDKADSYLGMGVNRNDKLDKILLTQKGLVLKIAERYPNAKGKKPRAPSATTLLDPPKENTPDAVLVDQREYLSIVMQLMYLARLTRPDVLLPVTYLATRSNKASVKDMKSVQQVIDYLAGTIDIGVNINCRDLQLFIMADASYGIHSDGKGHSGYMISTGKELSYLHARSAKQKTISHSSLTVVRAFSSSSRRRHLGQKALGAINALQSK
jgi:hypothetical protein